MPMTQVLYFSFLRPTRLPVTSHIQPRWRLCNASCSQQFSDNNSARVRPRLRRLYCRFCRWPGKFAWDFRPLFICWPKVKLQRATFFLSQWWNFEAVASLQTPRFYYSAKNSKPDSNLSIVLIAQREYLYISKHCRLLVKLCICRATVSSVITYECEPCSLGRGKTRKGCKISTPSASATWLILNSVIEGLNFAAGQHHKYHITSSTLTTPPALFGHVLRLLETKPIVGLFRLALSPCWRWLSLLRRTRIGYWGFCRPWCRLLRVNGCCQRHPGIQFIFIQ